MKETSVQINGEAWASAAAVRVRKDRAVRVKMRAGESGVYTVVLVEELVVNALFDFIAQ